MRREKGLTQAQLAEKLNVSRRTVSRWETGSNLPDLDVLMELADYFDVKLRELLDGERKKDKMDGELEKTVMDVADYSMEKGKETTGRLHKLFMAGLAAAIVYMALLFTDHADCFLGGMCLGVTFGMMIVGVIMTSRHAAKIRAVKWRLFHRMKHTES